jgi:hypothetical protein
MQIGARTDYFGACGPSPLARAQGRPKGRSKAAAAFVEPPTTWFEVGMIVLLFVIFQPLSRPALTPGCFTFLLVPAYAPAISTAAAVPAGLGEVLMILWL